MLLLMWQAGRASFYGLGPLLDSLVVVVLALLGVALISLVFELLFGAVAALTMLLLRRRPLWRARATRAGALTGLVTGLFVGCVGGLIMGGLPTKPAMLGLAVIVPLLPTLLGAALGLAMSRGWRPVWALAVVVCLLLNMGLLAGLLYSPTMTNSAMAGHVPPALVADPTLPGKYAVKTLTYGSGTDRRRPEYGELVDLRTAPVDIARIWSGPKGVAASYYRWFWGFTGEAVPLNGRVWYPEGEGPFPLVLMVHGNHTAGDYSDAGYAYLGELLASRGYIFASVDENFLNGSFAYNAQGEMPVRAYLLLRHVEVLLGLGGPLQGKVDSGKIALMGHSRGGEAAVVASVFNQMALYPSNSSVAMNFKFNIRAVAALAPCDGQYKVRGLPTVPENVDYLVLQGGQDTDVFSFSGVNQYERVTWNDGGYHFKTAVWVEHMNHGNMNTTWGTDRTAPMNWLYQEGPMLEAQAQRRVVKAYVSAFLDASLKGDRSYLNFLRDHRAGASWLPATAYAPLFTDTTFQAVEQFEVNADPKGPSLEGAQVGFAGLTVVEQQPVLRGTDRRQSKAGLLTWEAGGTAPSYEIRLPSSWQTDPPRALTFALGGARPAASVDLTVELVDRGGNAAQVLLSGYGDPLPPPANPVTKFGLLDGLMLRAGRPGPVLKTFVIPLADFVAANSAFRPAELAQIRFRFDRTPAGSVVIDDVGLMAFR
jgi:dienelactone hydrolase